ncbi:MAG: hypothetical protein LBT52_01805, partial [Clostridiales Family XIII bacterium]|nr:hypothetical protein [Clostridiales Family XIII bacterium]
MLAVVLSIAMLVAMTPNLAPTALFAAGDEPAAGDVAPPDSGVVNPTPEGEDESSAATEEDSEPASLRSVSFILPAGYLYGDGTNKFTIQVSEGDSVSPASIPVVPASADDIFTGWKTGNGSLVLTPDQIASQPVTSDTEYTASFEKIPGSTPDTDTKTKSKTGISPQATLTASTWAELMDAITNAADGDTIELTATVVQRAGGTGTAYDLPQITKNLTIDGKGNTLDFRNAGSTTALNRPGFRLGANLTATFTLKDVDIIRSATTYSLIGTSTNTAGTSYTAHDAGATTASAGWTVNFENLNSTPPAIAPTCALVSVPNGKVNFIGKNTWLQNVNTGYR